MAEPICPACGQLLRVRRYGVFLPPRKAAMLDLIVARVDIGVTVQEQQALEIWRDRRTPTPHTIRSHIYQINEMLADTGQRVVSIGNHFVLVRLPSRIAEAAE